MSYGANYSSLGDEGLWDFWCAAFRRRRKRNINSPNDQTGPRGREQT